MTREELKALKIAAATIKNAEHIINAAREFSSSGKPGGKTLAALITLAGRSLSELREARLIVEAHAASGLAFPALAEELFNLLEAGRPELLSYLSNREADEWEAEARAILAAAPGRLAGAGGASPEDHSGGNAGEPPSYPRIRTARSTAALTEAFSELVEAGYIAKTNEDGGNMLEPFLNSFEIDPKQPAGIAYNSKPQGRIIWAKKAGRGPNKAALIAFLYLNGLEDWNKWKKISAAIFGIELSNNERKKYATQTDKPTFSSFYYDLKDILRARL